MATANDSSFMQIDNLITTNVKVGRLMANGPAGAAQPGAAIDLAFSGGNEIGFVFPASYFSMQPTVSPDPAGGDAEKAFVELKTKDQGLRFVFGEQGAAPVTNYEIAASEPDGFLQHVTSARAHDFVTAASDKRLRIAGGDNAVSLTALDGAGALAKLTLGASQVEIPSGNLAVSNKLRVNDVEGVVIGDGYVPIELSAPTRVSAGSFHVGNVMSVDSNMRAIGVNAPPSATHALTIGGNAHVVGNITCDQDVTVQGVARFAGGANVAGRLSAEGNISAGGSLTAAAAIVKGALEAASVSVSGDSSAKALFVTGNASVGNLLATGNASISGSLQADSASLAAVTVTKGCTIGGNAFDPTKTLSVLGSTQITGSMSVAGNIATAGAVAVGGAPVANRALSVWGSSNTSGDAFVGGSVVTTSIGSTNANLALNANVLYFNTNQVMFKGNSYIVNANTTTYTDKVIRLGDASNPNYNNAMRDGSGIALVGAPDNKPPGVQGNIHMRWLATNGIYDATGNIVSSEARSRWEFAGGNLALKAPDEKNSYMFSIDAGILNIYKCVLSANGTTATQLVAQFGRNATI